MGSNRRVSLVRGRQCRLIQRLLIRLSCGDQWKGGWRTRRLKLELARLLADRLLNLRVFL